MYAKLKKFIHSSLGRYIISILLGVGLASLFRKACESRNCLVFKGPSIDKLKDNIYDYNGKCYKFKENATKCNQKERQVDFENNSEEIKS